MNPKEALYTDKEGNTVIVVSSSLVKKMYFKNMIREDFCNLYFWWCDLKKKCDPRPTKSMLEGLYFETGVLGCCAGGEMVTDLPRHKVSGAKLTDQIRIDELIAMWDQFAHMHDIIVVKEGPQKNVQKHYTQFLDIPEITQRWPKTKVLLKMDVDLISPIKDEENVSYEAAVIDLKLTGSLTNTFGEFAWGDPSHIDHLQAFFYSFFLKLPFLYVVAGMKEGEYRIFPVNTDRNSPVESLQSEANTRYAETIRRIIDYVDSVMERETRDQWLLQWGSKDRCKSCPFTQKCKSAKQFKTI